MLLTAQSLRARAAEGCEYRERTGKKPRVKTFNNDVFAARAVAQEDEFPLHSLFAAAERHCW